MTGRRVANSWLHFKRMSKSEKDGTYRTILSSDARLTEFLQSNTKSATVALNVSQSGSLQAFLALESE